MVRVMAKRDARSLDHATLEEMRRLAVKRVVEGGEAQVAVARSLEVHPVTVAKWVGTYRRRGDAGLARRIAPGPRPTLTPKQQAQLRRWIIDRTPQQFRFPFALWTLPLIGQVIEQRFGVVLHKTTIARLLTRLGLSRAATQQVVASVLRTAWQQARDPLDLLVALQRSPRPLVADFRLPGPAPP